MANFQFQGRQFIFRRGHHRCKRKKISDFFYTYDPFKKWTDNPEIKNFPLIHLRIYKKFLIDLHSHHKNPKKFFYTYDPFKKWFPNPKIENFPLMHLRIYKKKFIPSQSEEQDGFQVLLVKWDLGWGCPAHRGDPRPKILWVVNLTHELVKPPKLRKNRRY